MEDTQKDTAVVIHDTKPIVPPQEGEVVQTDPISLDTGYLSQAKQWEDFVGLWMTSREVDIRN